MPDIKLTTTPWQLAICKLSDMVIPEWARASGFVCFTRTPQEFSLVCEAECVPDQVLAERGWRSITVVGPLDFSMVGIIAGMTHILAAARISVFVISTYNTDYLLVKADRLEAAADVLKSAGYEFVS